MAKRIVAIGRQGKGFDELIVDPDFCPHESVVTVETGHQYTFAGEATDNMETFVQCLDCGHVQWDNGSWHAHQQDFNTNRIPF
jgi:hypothetical protein